VDVADDSECVVGDPEVKQTLLSPAPVVRDRLLTPNPWSVPVSKSEVKWAVREKGKAWMFFQFCHPSDQSYRLKSSHQP
jgi:hypothetical protein